MAISPREELVAERHVTSSRANEVPVMVNSLGGFGLTQFGDKRCPQIRENVGLDLIDQPLDQPRLDFALALRRWTASAGRPRP